MNEAVTAYLSRIGARGGRISRRELRPEDAKAMVRVREARRAFRRFHAQCFWSSDPNYRIVSADLPWVAKQLMKYGGHAGWDLGAKLCR